MERILMSVHTFSFGFPRDVVPMHEFVNIAVAFWVYYGLEEAAVLMELALNWLPEFDRLHPDLALPMRHLSSGLDYRDSLWSIRNEMARQPYLMHFFLGEIYLRQGKYDAASLHLEQFLEVLPDFEYNSPFELDEWFYYLRRRIPTSKVAREMLAEIGKRTGDIGSV
jgi:hypothetical protein